MVQNFSWKYDDILYKFHMVQNSSILVKNVLMGDFNPIPLLLLNHRLSAKLAPAFILLCKILTLRKIF